MNQVHLLLIVSMASSTVYTYPASHSHDISTLVVAPFINAREVTNTKIAQLVGSKAFPIVPLFPDSGRKHAVLEQESLVSKVDTAYGNLQELVANFYHPQPIVDTIQEHEKYGNDGGKSRSAAVAVIAGVEGISNLINAVIDAPFETARQFNKKFSATASSVGAKISGL